VDAARPTDVARLPEAVRLPDAARPAMDAGQAKAYSPPAPQLPARATTETAGVSELPRPASVGVAAPVPRPAPGPGRAVPIQSGNDGGPPTGALAGSPGDDDGAAESFAQRDPTSSSQTSSHGPSTAPQGAPRTACTAPQLKRFIKSRVYVPMHELRRRFQINGNDDEVTVIQVGSERIYIGLPDREGRLLAELLRGGDVGYELSLDPPTPIVVGLYPMRPIPRL
jgi:hypothetical protein